MEIIIFVSLFLIASSVFLIFYVSVTNHNAVRKFNKTRDIHVRV